MSFISSLLNLENYKPIRSIRPIFSERVSPSSGGSNGLALQSIRTCITSPYKKEDYLDVVIDPNDIHAIQPLLWEQVINPLSKRFRLVTDYTNRFNRNFKIPSDNKSNYALPRSIVVMKNGDSFLCWGEAEDIIENKFKLLKASHEGVELAKLRARDHHAKTL